MDDVPENSIILSPEELARLGINIDTLTTAADKKSKPKNGKQGSLKTKKPGRLTPKNKDKSDQPRHSQSPKNLILNNPQQNISNQPENSKGSTLPEKHVFNSTAENNKGLDESRTLIEHSVGVDVQAVVPIGDPGYKHTQLVDIVSTEIAKVTKTVENVSNNSRLFPNDRNVTKSISELLPFMKTNESVLVRNKQKQPIKTYQKKKSGLGTLSKSENKPKLNINTQVNISNAKDILSVSCPPGAANTTREHSIDYEQKESVNTSSSRTAAAPKLVKAYGRGRRSKLNSIHSTSASASDQSNQPGPIQTSQTNDLPLNALCDSSTSSKYLSTKINKTLPVQHTQEEYVNTSDSSTPDCTKLLKSDRPGGQSKSNNIPLDLKNLPKTLTFDDSDSHLNVSPKTSSISKKPCIESNKTSTEITKESIKCSNIITSNAIKVVKTYSRGRPSKSSSMPTIINNGSDIKKQPDTLTSEDLSPNLNVSCEQSSPNPSMERPIENKKPLFIENSKESSTSSSSDGIISEHNQANSNISPKPFSDSDSFKEAPSVIEKINPVGQKQSIQPNSSSSTYSVNLNKHGRKKREKSFSISSILHSDPDLRNQSRTSSDNETHPNYPTQSCPNADIKLSKEDESKKSSSLEESIETVQTNPVLTSTNNRNLLETNTGCKRPSKSDTIPFTSDTNSDLTNQNKEHRNDSLNTNTLDAHSSKEASDLTQNKKIALDLKDQNESVNIRRSSSDSSKATNILEKPGPGSPSKFNSSVSILDTSLDFTNNPANFTPKDSHLKNNVASDNLNSSEQILDENKKYLSVLNESSEKKSNGKRGRGRPKKSDVSSIMDTNTANKTETNLIISATSNINLVKKRGRPKKVLVSEKTVDSLTPSKVSKKRKRDSQQNDETESDSDDEPLAFARKKIKIESKAIDSDDDEFKFSHKLGSGLKRNFFLDSSDDDQNSNLDNTKNIFNESANQDESTCQPVKTPKKRGRPLKSATKAAAKNIPEPEESFVFETSKKGRQRKMIDYSLSENPDFIDEGKCRKKTKNSKPAANLHSTYDYGGDVSTDEYNESVADLESTSNNRGNGEDGQSEEEAVNMENPKYKWTGQTTIAVNQMFSSLLGTDVNNCSKDTQSGFTKRKRGRTKMTPLTEDGSAVCMVCSQTIDNADWLDHRRIVHYNLAWRKGDIPLDVYDDASMQKTFAQLRKEQGYLQCYKCKKTLEKVKSFIDHLEICNGVINATGSVTCAVCKKEMKKTEWQYHKYREHNNLTWREGDAPLDLQDQDVVFRILQQLYKNKKPLHCEICKQQKKSVLGFLSHKSVCQASNAGTAILKVQCELCGRKVLPVSMTSHMKMHSKPKVECLDESGYFNVDVGTSGPRKAATYALRVIKSIKGELSDSLEYYANQCDFEDDFVVKELKKRATENTELSCLFPNCDVKSTYASTMAKHLNECDKKPKQFFVCKLCLTWCTEEDEIKEHIKEKHRIADTGDEEVELDNAASEEYSDEDQIIEVKEARKKRLRTKVKITLMKDNKVKPLFMVHPIPENTQNLVYSQAFPWMLSFCQKYYSNSNLFEIYRNNAPWQVLDCDILYDYLPRLHVSCDITVKPCKVTQKLDEVGELEFRKLDLFEVCKFYEGEATIFCGGPISSIAWLPTPFDQEYHEQILAVAVLNEVDREYVVGETYNEPHVIQFWNFGKLQYEQDEDFHPYLLFGLALTTGPVWHMEWCPSGCLESSDDRKSSRLGLLAVATSDSFVYIYSIDNVEEECDRGLIYMGEPLVKLQLENIKSANVQPYYATRISWTKAQGHRYIAVGYSTGVIALFDLLSTSSLWQREDKSGTRIILPYQSFQGHVSCITALTLGHFSGGNRWCFSAGQEKALIFWDLFNTTKVTYHRKYGISEGLWLTQWPTCLVAEDESTYNDNGRAHSLIKPIRDVMCAEFFSFTHSPSGMKTIAFADWLNMIMHGGNSGEVLGQFTHRLFFNIDKKRFKNSYTQCIFSVAQLIHKGYYVPENGCPTYAEATACYGLEFVDYNSDKLIEVPNTKTNDIKSIKLKSYDLRDYPLRTINKVAVNPNPQACTFYATGYQAGFVRVRGLEILKNNFKPLRVHDYDFAASL